MTAPSKVLELVERFDRSLDLYKRPGYKEAWVRIEFINPFFEALGWDVHNVQGRGEHDKDVVYEDTIKIGGKAQAPDYSFRVGRKRKFFLEAKKPSVSLKGDIGPAYQLRRYSWNVKLPLGILTDFEEFAVYDCRRRPKPTHKANVGRIMYLTFDQYADRFDEIYGAFSKEAVLEGSFDRYVQETKPKRGTSEVDAELLKEIEGWRDTLARNIALRNPALSVHELNFAVQRTIDRIIFLRMCEDRGIEEYGRLLALTGGRQIYSRMGELYRQADAKYNAGLFDFRADTLTRTLIVDDKVLKPILAGLYFPECPYEFSVLPVEILGQVYEQFLGKVIRLTPSHRAKVEEKPEVRKAGGVYYTPSYIVDYIVERTVGQLIEGKTPRQIGKLRILDPACGSGSFLLGAYQFLLNYHRDWYENNDPAKHARHKQPAVYQGQRGKWRLTGAEKKRILLNNIYGVDIDRQAVEVTKLGLQLKVLEGETDETLGQQLTLWRERALPDLGNNIKCGNSLIGPDFFEGKQIGFFDEEARYRVNVFDWETEFPEIMGRGGFDVVIGNPPYGIVFDESRKRYLEQHCPTFVRNNDRYVAFTEKSLHLLKTQGLFGFIIPNTFLLGPYFDELKRYILDKADVLRIVDFSINQVFRQPNVFTALLFLRRRKKEESYSEVATRFFKVADIASFPKSVIDQVLEQERLNLLRWSPANPLAEKLREWKPKLDDVAWVKDVGLNYWTKGRGKVRGGSIADRTMYKGERQHPEDTPYLTGRDINRYSLSFGNRWLRHDYQDRLDPRVDTLRFSPEFLEREKMIYRQTADRIIATLDPNGMLTNKTLHLVVLRDEWRNVMDLLYVLGILNSSAMNCLYRAISQEEGRAFAQVKIFRMKQMPIRVIDPFDSGEKARHDRMVDLVGGMLTLHQQLAAAKMAQDRTLIQRQIDATDRQIDRLVYELYELTDEEIKIVEGAAK